MTERDFIYWLNGFAELTEGDTISTSQWKMIKEHLNFVIEKKTPKLTPTKFTEIDNMLKARQKPLYMNDTLFKIPEPLIC